jgi:histidinol-phosphate aminotransferase
MEQQPIGPVPVPRLLGLRAYRRSSMPACVDLRLDGNEGAAPDPDRFADLVDALRLAGPEVLRSYPSAAALEDALAARHGVPAEQVLVTAGGDETLDRVFRAFCEPGREVVLPEPSFEMLPRYAALAGCAVREVGWPDGTFPLDAVLAALGPATAAVFVVTPNNPTGAVATLADLRALAAAAPRALLVLDHAYAEFGDEDLTADALCLPNVLVVRTLSKAFGLAGLRIGYALGGAAVIEALRKAGSPYSVPGPSLLLALRALQDGDAPVAAFVARVREEREALAGQLRALGFAVPPSQGNFVLARGPRAGWLWTALRALGIAVRAFPGRPGLGDALRITCPGEPLAFARLGRAIDAALAPDALLFDLDGVLADVSGSYRAAIVGTAASYGVELDAHAIRAAKAAGDANNDWELTRRLLAARGVEAPLDEVTARFEALYQGGPGRPGLRETERPLLDAAAWEALAARRPIGVVTGRPRADAEHFLAAHGLLPACRVLVCMEDGPRKPDPFPIRRALEGLGARHAWYLGDTRDDLEAARAAGAVPIGVVAPGEPAAGATAHLDEHGAAAVLRATHDLTELLRWT